MVNYYYYYYYSVTVVGKIPSQESGCLIMVLEAILTRRQPHEKLQCLYENLMFNNFCKTAFLKKKNMNCKLKLHSAKDFTTKLLGQ